MSPIITENIWRDSPLSIVKYYGKINYNGDIYFLVNKEGITILDLSDPESQHYVGDGNMAIPPNEPADLCLQEWLLVYQTLGRDRTIELVIKGTSLKDALEIIRKEKEP